MGNDFVNHTVCEGMQTGNLTAGAADAQPLDWYLRGINNSANLIKNRIIALPGSPNRIAVRTQINICQDCVVRFSQKNRLGSGWTHVDPEYARITRTDFSFFNGFEFHHVFKMLQGGKCIKWCSVSAEQIRYTGKFGGLVFQTPEGRAQSFEIRRFRRNNQTGNLLTQTIDHHMVASRPSGDHNVLSFHLF